MKLTTAFVLSALIVSASAGPVVQKSGGIRVALTKRTDFATSVGLDTDGLRAHISYTTAKFDRGFIAYQNNTGKAHPLASDTLVQNLTKRAASSVPLINNNNMMWHGAITVGTPPQNFTVDFDTGSSDLILPNPACSTSCKGHRTYKPNQSSSSEGLYSAFSTSFGDSSSVFGTQYRDTVTIAGMTAKSQTLGTALTYSSGFASTRFPADGLLGMAFKPISELNANPFFQTLLSQQHHTHTTSSSTALPGTFAFKLAHNDSELTLGGVNAELYTGEFAWSNVTEEGYWQVEMGGLSVGNETFGEGHAAIIDTGTTLLIADTQTVASVYASIPGAKPAPSLGSGFYTFPCPAAPSSSSASTSNTTTTATTTTTTNTTPPTISLSFGGRSFAIPSGTFSLGPVTKGGDVCVGGLVANDDMKFWIVGDLFLRGVYTAFDVQGMRVGFADLA